MNKVCNSCRVDIVNSEGSTIFKCPKCAKYEIVRCGECRKLASKYQCAMCEFVGPN